MRAVKTMPRAGILQDGVLLEQVRAAAGVPPSKAASSLGKGIFKNRITYIVALYSRPKRTSL